MPGAGEKGMRFSDENGLAALPPATREWQAFPARM